MTGGHRTNPAAGTRAPEGQPERRDGRWRRQRLADARLYVCCPIRADLDALLDAVLAAGVDLIQLRDKEAGTDALRTAAAVFRAAAARHGALFIVNDDPELAAEVGADGVHVGQEDPSPETARDAVGDGAIIGYSTHSAGQIDGALDRDCDYFSVGPVRETPTKQGRPGTGMAPVRHAVEVADRPWFVTGGMAPDTAPEVIEAGAHGIVVVRAVIDADDPARAAGELSTLLP